MCGTAISFAADDPKMKAAMAAFRVLSGNGGLFSGNGESNPFESVQTWMRTMRKSFVSSYRNKTNAPENPRRSPAAVTYTTRAK